MPNDTLREEIDAILRAAIAFVGNNRPDRSLIRHHLKNLESAEQRLTNEINYRTNAYVDELQIKESNETDNKRKEVTGTVDFKRAAEVQKANQERFQKLRQVNEGGYPKNISPVLYSIPLILIGVAEWYVNFSTFAAMFIPVFAIAATVIVAAVFAWASHLHGAYLKQISEIRHPSTEYRNVLGRYIILWIVTFLLIAAFATVVWLRWLLIADQLGTNVGIQGTFGGTSSSMVWSKVGPTIVVNLLIWGLGVLYSWAMHEKVPELRESYREYLRATAKVDKKVRPLEAEESRIRAFYVRERKSNEIVVDEYRVLLDNVRGIAERMKQSETT